MAAQLLVDTAEQVRTITLNRPGQRNALTASLMADLGAALRDADGDPGVEAVILTGTDPAFCAGLDLRELGTGTMALGLDDGPWSVLHDLAVPVIGAVNGPAVTGGLELALQCDFLVASERAAFADTHARVGAMPGGGMTGLLPQAVGLRYALEMSLTGNFVDAAEALRVGLVNRVVPHDLLMTTARRVAGHIVGNDRHAVRALKRNYREASRLSLGDALRLERERYRDWDLDPGEVERRRAAVIERGRSQME